MESAIRVQILDKAINISHNAKTFEKGMNPSVLYSSYGKIIE